MDDEVMCVEVPAPADLNGDALRAELAAAGIDAEVLVTFIGDQPMLRLVGADPADEATIDAVVAAHVPPPPPDPLPTIEDLLARIAVLEAALGNA